MSVCSATRSLSNLMQLVLDGIQTGNAGLISQINIQIELLNGNEFGTGGDDCAGTGDDCDCIG